MGITFKKCEQRCSPITHRLVPFDLGFFANREVSSDSRDFPLVLNSLWARSSRVLRTEEGKRISGLLYHTGVIIFAVGRGMTEKMVSEKNGSYDKKSLLPTTL